MEITLELKTAILHIIVGSFIGFISNFMKSNITALLMAIVILLAVRRLSYTFFKISEHATENQKYDTKWWLSNCAYPYLIFWLFVWIIFYNL